MSDETPAAATAESPARPKRPRKRDAEASKKAILDAALVEFAEFGYSGARIDRIALSAGLSKPMIYDYFGDKDAIYAAALREAYAQIRAEERRLNLDLLDPRDAIRELVRFTMRHFWEKPWFVAMLNTENLRGGETIRQIADAKEIQSELVSKLGTILRRGVDAGTFRTDITPVDLYVYIASLCWFPISNRFTLEAVFNLQVTPDWLTERAIVSAEMVNLYLCGGTK